MNQAHSERSPTLAAPDRAFQEASTIQQGRRLSLLARDALRAYGKAPRHIRRVREGYCTTFRVTDEGGDVLALKAGRVGTETLSTLRWEALWARHLHDCGVRVAPHLATTTGDVISVGSAPLAGTRPCIAYAWIPGRRQKSVSDTSAEALGRLIARAHGAGRTFRPPSFERKTWTLDRMCGKWSSPDPLVRHLSNRELNLVDRWHERIDRVCQPLSDRSASWGPILADVGPHNIVWNRQQPWLIDFNDAGWGCYAYDLAILWHLLILRGPRIEAPLLRGYQEICPLPEGWGLECKAAAILRLMRWRAPRDGKECRRLMGRLLVL